MATKPEKKFDCVKMKRQAQEKILAEGELRKGEFPSYGDFLEAGTQESDWSRRIWEKARRHKSPAAV
jgi:hypothetical protein